MRDTDKQREVRHLWNTWRDIRDFFRNRRLTRARTKRTWLSLDKLIYLISLSAVSNSAAFACSPSSPSFASVTRGISPSETRIDISRETAERALSFIESDENFPGNAPSARVIKDLVEFFNDPLSSKDVLTTYKPIRNECSFFDRPEDGGERAKQVLNIDTLDEGQSCNSVLDRLHVLIITTIQYCDQLAWQQLTRFAATQRVVEPIVGTFQNPVGSAASNLILGAAPNALSDESYVQLWQSSIKSANRAGRTNGVGVGGVGTGRIGIKAFAEPEDFDLKRFNFDYYNGLEPFQNSMMAGLIAEVSADRTLSLKGTLIPIVPASQKLPRDRSRRSHLVVWDREISSFGEVVAAAVGDTKMISIQKFTDGLTTGLAKGSYIVLGNGFELQNYFARHSLQPDDFPEYVTGFARRVLGAPVSGSVRN